MKTESELALGGGGGWLWRENESSVGRKGEGCAFGLPGKLHKWRRCIWATTLTNINNIAPAPSASTVSEMCRE